MTSRKQRRLRRARNLLARRWPFDVFEPTRRSAMQLRMHIDGMANGLARHVLCDASWLRANPRTRDREYLEIELDLQYTCATGKRRR